MPSEIFVPEGSKKKTGSRLIGQVEKTFVDKAYQEAEVWELTKLEWMADKIQKDQ